jgi:hypothetical protein
MDAALLQERQAYDEMRALVSDLTLPADLRAPLDREQANAVANYDHARERVRLLRASHSATRPGSDFPLDIDPIDLEPQG